MSLRSQSRRDFLASAVVATAAVAATPASAASQDLTALTLKQASDLVRNKTVSPVDLTQAFLKQIARYDSEINSFIAVTSELALAQAREMEAEQHRWKWRGPLQGIPIALKDIIDTAGTRTTAASELFKDRVPTDDADVVRRLKA